MIKHEKILIVDDDLLSLHLSISFLSEHKKYILFQASSVVEAFKIIEKELIDLIITDWEMPYLNGIEFTKKLKESKKTKQIPVILITGKRISTENLEVAYNAGVVDFIRKPFDQTELFHRIRAVLKLIEFQNDAIIAKNKELAAHATHIAKYETQHNETLKHLLELEPLIKKDNKKALHKIQKIINQFKSNSKINSWENFEQYFNLLHPEFTKSLIENTPDLSPQEIKLATLIRLNMESKVIARTLNVSENTVKTYRKRLRDKLNLSRKDNLTSYISMF